MTRARVRRLGCARAAAMTLANAIDQRTYDCPNIAPTPGT
jgi:hypothetical protein